MQAHVMHEAGSYRTAELLREAADARRAKSSRRPDRGPLGLTALLTALRNAVVGTR